MAEPGANTQSKCARKNAKRRQTDVTNRFLERAAVEFISIIKELHFRGLIDWDSYTVAKKSDCKTSLLDSFLAAHSRFMETHPGVPPSFVVRPDHTGALKVVAVTRSVANYLALYPHKCVVCSTREPAAVVAARCDTRGDAVTA